RRSRPCRSAPGAAPKRYRSHLPAELHRARPPCRARTSASLPASLAILRPQRRRLRLSDSHSLSLDVQIPVATVNCLTSIQVAPGGGGRKNRMSLPRRQTLAGLGAMAALPATGAFAASPPLPSAPVALNIIDVAGNLALTQPAFEAYAKANPKLVSA